VNKKNNRSGKLFFGGDDFWLDKFEPRTACKVAIAV
jgi:hypothetical protein